MHPNKINTPADMSHYDKIAAEEIEYAEKIIENLKAYRSALFERYQEIITASYKMQLSIKRKNFSRYSGRNQIAYIVTIEKIFNRSDINPQAILSETYEGRERFKALKRFDELKKQYAGIEAIKDIEKRTWER